MAKIGTATPEDTFVPNSEQAKQINKIASLSTGGMQTGYGVSPDTQVDGAATRYQQLDGKIRNLTYGANDFTILRQLMDKCLYEAKSTVEQYVVFREHGETGHSQFQPEIGISEIGTPRQNQRVVNMKYIVSTRAESFPAQRAENVASPDRINLIDAIVSNGKTIEFGIFYGDSNLTADSSSQGLEFDGLSKLIDSDNLIDNRGFALTPALINAGAAKVGEGYGVSTDLYMPVGVKADFDNQFMKAEWIAMPTPSSTTAGSDIMTFESARGSIKMHGSTIMDIDKKLNTEAEANPKAPTKPVIASATVQTGANGQFRDDKRVQDEQNIMYDNRKDVNIAPSLPPEVGQELSYVAVAVNNKGDSLPSDPVTATVKNTTDAVQITVSPLTGYGKADYIAIYRKSLTKNGKYWLIGQVAGKDAQDDGSLVFTDTNEVMPQTADVFMGQLDETVIGLYEFLPMTRVNLATTTTALSFLVLWYGALALFKPKRWVKISNVRYVQTASDIYPFIDATQPAVQEVNAGSGK